MVRIFRYRVALTLAMLAWVLLPGARADTFDNVSYEGRTDELIVTMRYRGTNPDHGFSLKWGECHRNSAVGVGSVNVDVIDDQWQDAEQADYVKTIRFSLNGLTCRPAKVILFTPPRFEYGIFIPAKQP